MKVLIIFLSVLMSGSAFAEKVSFSVEEVINPLGKSRIKNFLLLMKNPENRKMLKLASEKIDLVSSKQDNSLLLQIGQETYQVYWEDFNNDGKSEYLLIYLDSGSGKYNGIVDAFSKFGKAIVLKDLEAVIISNLFPGKDISRFHSYLGDPFAVKINGKIYLRFKNNLNDKKHFVYKWENGKFLQVTI